MHDVGIAFGLTLFAGMGTAIGSVIAFSAQRTNYRFLSITTGFSAGVMLYVSFVEIYAKGVEALAERFGESGAHWINACSFFGGMLLVGLIDQLIPTARNPHETHPSEETDPLHDRSNPGPGLPARRHALLRMGLLTALAIGIHNFPEGLATFLAALEDPALGLTIAIAIALHNIPEGISVSVPIYYATGSRRRAFLWSALSGLAEPVGAIVAYAAILLFLGGRSGVVPPEIMGVLFGGVAGIMVYISLDQLLPTSRAYGKGHDTVIGLVSGMAVMALSLLLLK
jgi:ZIP family zinc transporter